MFVAFRAVQEAIKQTVTIVVLQDTLCDHGWG